MFVSRVVEVSDITDMLTPGGCWRDYEDRRCLMSIKKIELTDANFDAETSKGLCVVCFGEPTDHVCRKQAEITEDAAGAIAGQLTVGICDVKDCPTSAQRLRITNIPVTIIFKDGIEVERLVGCRHEATLIEHLKREAGESM